MDPKHNNSKIEKYLNKIYENILNLERTNKKIPRASITCSNKIKYFQKRKWNLIN